MRAAPVPGAVIGTLRNFELAWITPIGVQAVGSSQNVTGTTLFQAASLTKQVTAYAALKLQTQQKLDLDRPLVEYVDDMRDPGARSVTARHVLSHSSGFRNWRFAEAGKPLPELVPAFKPGSKYSYSGEGYFYLQRVIEQITGAGFGQAVQDLVFNPMQMKSSALVWDPRTLAQTALPHDRRGEIRTGWDKAARALHAEAERKGKTVRQLRYEEYAALTRETGHPALPNWMQPNGASSMLTNAEDYARFLAAALRNREIANQQIEINEFLGWGLGWAIERAAGHTYVWQWGDNGGFKNIVMAEPSTGSAVFVFTNGDAGTRVYDRVVTHATGHDHPALFWL
jgi:CubicO group peptidase (beta-lactamase class C family)